MTTKINFAPVSHAKEDVVPGTVFLRPEEGDNTAFGQALFPVPTDVQTASNKGIRTITFANEGDFVSFRHHVGVKTGKEEVYLSEVGPRFEMRLFEIRLGTAENTIADVEWRLTPYQRRGRKEVLSEN